MKRFPTASKTRKSLMSRPPTRTSSVVLRSQRALVDEGWSVEQGARHGGAHLGGRARDQRAGGGERRDLVLGAALAARDDGARVAHAAPGRCRHAGDEGHHRLGAGTLHSPETRTQVKRCVNPSAS